MAGVTGPDGSDEKGEQRAEGAARIARAAAAGRNRLAADANLIGALVRIDELEVATRALEEQRSDLVEYAIDLREAVADAVRQAGEAPSGPAIGGAADPA